MPALPKRRRSKASQGHHSSHRRLRLPSLAACQHSPARCNGVLPHRVCPVCGFYRNRDILGINTATR